MMTWWAGVTLTMWVCECGWNENLCEVPRIETDLIARTQDVYCPRCGAWVAERKLKAHQPERN